MAAHWGQLIHRDVRPLLAMLEAHEGALERTLGQILASWELSLAVPALGEAKLSALIGAYLYRVGDQAVLIQDRAWRRLEKKDVQTFRQARIDWARAHGAELAVNLTGRMRRRIADILAAGLAANLSPDQLRRQMQAIVPALPGISARTRAELIARTELHNAAMRAQELEAQALASHGVIMVKVWTATMDHRTRPAHRQANGQVRQLNQDFNVGGARMSRPGDPRGGARNVIRCRCVARFIPRGYVEEDRYRRAGDMIRVAQRSGATQFIAEIDRLTSEMDPALARVVRAEAQRSESWAASADAMASAEAAAGRAAQEEPGN